MPYDPDDIQVEASEFTKIVNGRTLTFCPAFSADPDEMTSWEVLGSPWSNATNSEQNDVSYTVASFDSFYYGDNDVVLAEYLDKFPGDRS